MRAMKDSGVEWIGEIPESWDLLKIGSVYTERNIKVSDKEYAPLSVTKQGVVPQLATAAKSDDGDNRKLIKVNDFVINSRSDRRGSCGISAYDGSCSLINTVLQPRGAMCNKYYSYLFKSDLFADEFYKWGTGIVDDLWSTKWSNMKRIYIPAPKLDEQQRIADYLDTKCSKIDTIISKQEAVIEKLKAYKQSIITEAVTKGLNPDVEMKDSGIEWIGDIPKNWSVQRIKYIMFERTERTIDGHEQQLSVTQDRGIIRAEEAKAANPSNSTEGYRIVNVNDLVFNKYKAHSGVFFVTNYDGIVTFNYSVYRCYNQHNSKYYEYLFKTVGCIGEFKKRLHGVGDSISPLYTKDLFDISVVVPPLDVQNLIINYLTTKCSNIDSIIANKQSVINKLTEYKKSLIYEVVTGKKEV